MGQKSLGKGQQFQLIQRFLRFFSMTDDRNPLWDEFEVLGIKAVRQRIAEHIFGEAKQRQAIHWMTHREAAAAPDARTAIPDEARAATEEARKANAMASEANRLSDQANRSADAANRLAREANRMARRNKTVAMIAVVAAMISAAFAVWKK